jgi:hypothetical protein
VTEVRGADAARDRDRRAGDRERLVQRFPDPLGHHPGVRGGGEHRELVAAQPGQGVPGRERRPQSARDLHQESVPAGVPEGIVDRLEVVEVDQQHGDLPTGLHGLGEGPTHHGEEHRAVRQAGQVVVEGVPLQFRFAVDRLEAQLLGVEDLAEQRRAHVQQGRVVVERSRLPVRVHAADGAEQVPVRPPDGHPDVGTDRHRPSDPGGRVLGDGHRVGSDLRGHPCHHVLTEGVRPGVRVAVRLAVRVVLHAQVELALTVVVADRPEGQRDLPLEMVDDELAGLPEGQRPSWWGCGGTHHPGLLQCGQGGEAAVIRVSIPRYLRPVRSTGGFGATREWITDQAVTPESAGRVRAIVSRCGPVRRPRAPV